eukprot:c18654_g1_i2 orf=3-239(-)
MFIRRIELQHILLTFILEAHTKDDSLKFIFKDENFSYPLPKDRTPLEEALQDSNWSLAGTSYEILSCFSKSLPDQIGQG